MWKTFTERAARRLFVSTLASLILLLCTTARAQVVNEETARIAFTEGLRLRDELHDPRAALEKLKAAHDLAVTARTSYELGKTYMMLGQLVEAEQMFLEVGRLPADPIQSAAGKEARDQSARLSVGLEGRIPAVLVRLTGELAPRAEVYIDGTRVPDAARSLPWKANPGVHHVVVKVPGAPDRSSDVTLVEGKTETVDVSVAPESAPPSTAAAPVFGPATSATGVPSATATPAAAQPTRTWNGARIGAVALGGAGAAAVIVGGVLALAAKSSFDEARSNQCGTAIGAPNDSLCTAAGASSRSSAGTQADVASVVMAVGGVALVGGAVVWLLSAPAPNGGTVGLGASPTGLTVRGSF